MVQVAPDHLTGLGELNFIFRAVQEAFCCLTGRDGHVETLLLWFLTFLLRFTSSPPIISISKPGLPVCLSVSKYYFPWPDLSDCHHCKMGGRREVLFHFTMKWRKEGPVGSPKPGSGKTQTKLAGF